MIIIVLELYMSKRNWKNIELVSCCERSEPNFFWGILTLVPLIICCYHSHFQLKTHRTRNQGLPIEISRKVPYIQGLFKDKFIFKDFSRKSQNSRTFQGLWEPWSQTHRWTDRQMPDKVILMCRYASQVTQKLFLFTAVMVCPSQLIGGRGGGRFGTFLLKMTTDDGFGNYHKL